MATSPSVVPNVVRDEMATVRALPSDLVDDLQRVQKAAQRISSILDLDQLIDRIVNEVTHSFGCVEASVFLHDEERGEMVMAGVCGCTVHCKGHRLKIGRKDWLAMSRPPDRCAMRQMFAMIRTTSHASRRRCRR